MRYLCLPHHNNFVLCTVSSFGFDASTTAMIVKSAEDIKAVQYKGKLAIANGWTY